MITIAFCSDSKLAREQRLTSFAPHMQHLRMVMKDIRLAAPLATADGAAIKDDDRLVASVFALETADPKQLMRRDPYTEEGVWESVALFEADDLFGEWRGQRAPGLYVVFSSAEPEALNAQRRYLNQQDGLLFFAARLTFSSALGTAAATPKWTAVSFLRAAHFEAVESVLAADPTVRSATCSCEAWAIPLAIGSWTGVTNL